MKEIKGQYGYKLNRGCMIYDRWKGKECKTSSQGAILPVSVMFLTYPCVHYERGRLRLAFEPLRIMYTDLVECAK